MNRDLVTFSLLGAAHSLNHSLFLVLPPLLPNIAASLGVSLSTLGLVATATFFIYGTGALIGGPLSDTIGSIKVARISIGLAGVFSLLFIAGDNIFTFSAAMFLMAAWASFYHPTANKLIAQAFPLRTGNAMGIHNAAGNIGQVLTPTVAFFLGTLIDWRFSFIFFGLLSIVTAYLLNRVELHEDALRRPEKITVLELLRVPNLWQILLFNALVGFVFRGVEIYFPTFLRIGRGFTGEFAAISNSLILAFGVAGQIIGGRGSDRFGPTKILLGATAGIVFSLVLLILSPTSIALVVIFTFLYGIVIFAHQPSMTTLVSRAIPLHLMGLSFGIMFFFTFGLGSVAAVICGYLIDLQGVELAFWVNTGVAVVLFLNTIIIYRTFSRFNHVSGR